MATKRQNSKKQTYHHDYDNVSGGMSYQESGQRFLQENDWQLERRNDGSKNGSGRGSRTLNGQGLATALGWFSIGLGVAEVLAPRGVAKVAGVKDQNAGLIRLFGLREIASGIGIFSQKRPAEAVWSRVAGDVLDLAALGIAFGRPSRRKAGSRLPLLQSWALRL